MSDNRRFRRGSGTYKCVECGKQTRETGSGESSAELCADCYLECELINAISDGEWPELAELAEKNPGVKLTELSKRLEVQHV